jgi:hypothetical protein
VGIDNFTMSAPKITITSTIAAIPAEIIIVY